jgi:hypothetical protein
MWHKITMDPWHHRAILAVTFGSMATAGRQLDEPSDRATLLMEDLSRLSKVTEAMGERRFVQQNTAEAALKKLQEVQKAAMKKLQEYKSTLERSQRKRFGPQNEPTHTCSICNKLFVTPGQLQRHKFAAHKEKHPHRMLVDSIVCPWCGLTYRDKLCTKRHFQNVCSKKMSVIELDNLNKLHKERVRASETNPETLAPISRDVMLMLLRGGVAG